MPHTYYRTQGPTWSSSAERDAGSGSLWLIPKAQQYGAKLPMTYEAILSVAGDLVIDILEPLSSTTKPAQGGLFVALNINLFYSIHKAP